MGKSRWLPLLVLVFSLALLLPGVTLPMVTIKGDLHRKSLVAEGKKIVKEESMHPAMATMAVQFLDGLKVDGNSRVYERTQSILGVICELWRSGYLVVAVLVVFFSVIIPFIKFLLLVTVALYPERKRALYWNSIISKWAMADVFAMGVLISCLAMGTSSWDSSILLLDMELLHGFYWFIAYCLFSVFAGQWLLSQLTLSSSQEPLQD